MAGTLRIGDILEFVSRNQIVDQVVLNTFHYEVKSITNQLTGLPVAVEIPARDVVPQVTLDFQTLWWSNIQPIMSTQVDLKDTMGQIISRPPASRRYVVYPQQPTNGTGAGESMPAQDCITFLRVGSLATRSHLGRVYLSGLPETVCEAGRLTVPNEPAVVAVGTFLAAPIVSQSAPYTVELQPVLVQKTLVGPGNITPITSGYLSDDIIKTQRRRRPGKGQ